MREAFGESFDVATGYLNTASMGVPPSCVVEAVNEAVATWSRGEARATDYDPAVSRARQAFADLVGVPVETVAIGGSVSALVALVAAGIPAGSRVLAARDEFTSVTFPFTAQAERGVVVDEAALEQLPTLAKRYDWVAVSVVQSKDGALVDLAALREAKQRSGVRVLLDVTQAAGWMALDLSWADAVVGAGYKWLLSPRGTAWIALHADIAGSLVPLAANWYAGSDERAMYGLPLRLREDSRRFDASPAWFSHVGAARAMPWLASLDLTKVQDHCVTMANLLRDRLGLPSSDSAILTVDGVDPARLHRAGVAATTRAAGTRLSCHLYTTEADVEAAVNAIRA